MPNNQQNLIFPMDTSPIIAQILEKYKLREGDEKFWEKFEKGEKTNEELLAGLVKQTATKKIGLKQLTDSLKQELNIPQKKATDLANDLKAQILSVVEKHPEETASRTEEEESKEQPPEGRPEQAPEQVSQERPKIKKPDTYREPLE